MDSVIKQILELENRAQEIVSAAGETSRQLAGDIEKDCAAIRADIEKRQENRLLKVEETERAEAEQQLAAIRKDNEAALSALKKLYADKKDLWIEEIYQNIVSLKHIL